MSDIRIAIDAMGGDKAPGEIVKGVVEASRAWPDLKLVLVGDQEVIKAELAKNSAAPSDSLSIFHASEAIAMCEPPAQAVRTKRDSSINRGMELLRDKKVDAFQSSGSTGAMVAAAILIARRSPAVKRPAIGTVFPTIGRPVLLLDAGANTDCGPVELEQFAIMGSIYSRAVLGQENPEVGLLSIGGEDLKGNDITKETLTQLRENKFLNFRGNVEGHDLFQGETDVIVCDGFVGNVVLKTIESEARAVAHMLKNAFKQNIFTMLAALLMRGALKKLKKTMDPETYGGAPLLGVNGTVIITHGASSHKAIYHAVRVAAECVRKDVAAKITGNLAALKKRHTEGLF